MKPVSEIVSGEYIVYESGELLKKAHYIKCFRLLNKQVMDPIFYKGVIEQQQIQIQQIRRLLYCCHQLLQKYFRKYSEKSHKVQPMLERMVQLCQYQSQYLQMYHGKNEDTTERDRSMGDSPSVKRKQIFREFCTQQVTFALKLRQMATIDYPQEFEGKSATWFKSQCFHYFVSLSHTMLYIYLYHKFTKQTDATFILQQLVKLCYKNKFENLKILELRTQLNIFIANAYFELNENDTSDKFYNEALSEAQIAILNILADVEKLKRNVTEPLLIKQLTKLISLVLVSLVNRANLNIHMDTYNRAIECYHLADYLNKILGFFENSKQLHQYVEEQSVKIKDLYGKNVKESLEICKFLNILIPKQEQIINYEVQDQGQRTIQQEYEEKLFAKMKYDHERTFIVRKKESMLPPRPVSNNQYYIQNQTSNTKILKQKHNNSCHSIDQPSTHCAESQMLTSSKYDSSKYELNKNDTTNKNDFTAVTEEPQPQTKSYLSQLIQLRNTAQHLQQVQPEEDVVMKNYISQKEAFQKLTNANSFIPLDKKICQYIDVNLQYHQKCLSLDEIKSNAKQIIGAENEVHKEVPITKQLLNARKLTSSKGLVFKDTETKFNKLLEYNAIEHFDFVTTQKNSAIKQLQNNREVNQVKFAEQSIQPKVQKRVSMFEYDTSAKKLAKSRTRAQPKSQQQQLFEFLNDEPIEQENDRIDIDEQELYNTAKQSIQSTLNQNQTHQIVIEHADIELKNQGFPLPFKRARSQKLNKYIPFQSILKLNGELSSSTKQIRQKEQPKSLAVELDEDKIKKWVSKTKIQ